jgi:bifunctional ADP-heptose synthase (sugar kinase/adenylyltransferase)
MRECTFGNSNAAKVLDKLVQDDKRTGCRVSHYYIKYTSGLKQIAEIKDLHFRVSIENIWLCHFKQAIAASNLAPIIKNYLTNIIVGYYRGILNKRQAVIEQERQEKQNEKTRKRKQNKEQAILDVRIAKSGEEFVDKET